MSFGVNLAIPVPPGCHRITYTPVLKGGLPKTATLMVWRELKTAKYALTLGNDVVMATSADTYFDYYQASAATELAKGKDFEAIGGLLPLEKAYAYNPAFIADNPAQEHQILGTQAQIWTEYCKDMHKIQYITFPRLAALAEAVWAPPARKNFPDFQLRHAGVILHYNAGHLNHGAP